VGSRPSAPRVTLHRERIDPEEIDNETRFIMNGGNHATDQLTTFPFSVFGSGWEVAEPESWPHRGDTVVGNDV
jgi:virginiamycin A acetyltransferase